MADDVDVLKAAEHEMQHAELAAIGRFFAALARMHAAAVRVCVGGRRKVDLGMVIGDQ